MLSPNDVRATPIVCMSVRMTFDTGVRFGRAMCWPDFNFTPALPATIPIGTRPLP